MVPKVTLRIKPMLNASSTHTVSALGLLAVDAESRAALFHGNARVAYVRRAALYRSVAESVRMGKPLAGERLDVARRAASLIANH